MAAEGNRDADAVVRDLRAGLVRDGRTRPQAGRRRRSGSPGARPARAAAGGRGPTAVRGCGLAVVLVAVALVGVGLVRGTQDTPAAGTGEPAAGDLAPFVPGPAPGGDGGVGPGGAGPGGTDPAGEDWASVVRGLDAARLAALRDLDEVGLRRVYVPAARALREDLAAVRTLRDAGLAPRGVEVEVESVELVGRPGFDRAVLRVSDRRGRYRLVEAGGRAVVSTVAAGEARTWRMVLQRDGADWRIARVRPTS